MKFWNFKAKDKDTGELMLYGDISSSTWWGDEVTPKDVAPHGGAWIEITSAKYVLDIPVCRSPRGSVD